MSTSKWVDGIEYELNPEYAFEVWEPVTVLDLTSTGTTSVVQTSGVVIHDGLAIEELGTTSTHNFNIHQMVSGDTPNAILVAGMPYGLAQNMTGDWACSAEILNNQRNAVSALRSITSTNENSNGVTAFQVEMTSAESSSMVNSYERNRPTGYYWLITVGNDSIPYRRTLEVEIAVRKR